MSNPIEISSLNVGYQKSILKNINITTETNKLIAVIGRNGEGKSTLLRTLSGLQPTLSGKFKFNNQDVFTFSNSERAKILSIVSTKQTNIGNISVADFIAFGRYPYTNWLGITKEHDSKLIEKAIDICKINYLADRNYEQLSDGEKQRVNIARAIAQNTSLIILDEPTTHLDLINKVEVLKLLKTLVEIENKTILFSTHMIEHSLQIADELWLVNKGTVENLSPKELSSHKTFNELFSNEHVIFDHKTMSFKII